MPRRDGIERENMALVEDMERRLLRAGEEVKGKNGIFRPVDHASTPLKYIRRHHGKTVSMKLLDLSEL